VHGCAKMNVSLRESPYVVYRVSIAIGGNPRDAKAVVVSKANAMLAAMWPGNRR
jgi:hypothetical protein